MGDTHNANYNRYPATSKMTLLPSKEIDNLLYKGSIERNDLSKYLGTIDFIHCGSYDEINWLNTPGPFYTTFTDNCGTGQAEALNNVGVDEYGREVIFKQPFTEAELLHTLSAAITDPFSQYYCDGNDYWNRSNVTEWWENSPDRISYILKLYKDELNIPIRQPIPYDPPKPQTFHYWLDFYQHNMKSYLEWYINRLHREFIDLPAIDYEWSKKEELDSILKSRS